MAAEYQMEDFMTDFEVPETEFVVFGIAYAFPEHADALEAVYAETTKIALSEPGCVYYCICRDQDDRTAFHFFERYKGRKAFEAHVAHSIQKKMKADGLIKGVKAKFVKPIQPAKAS